MRVVQSFLSLDSLKLIYCSYFHSILTYGIIFWGNTHYSNAIFKMQKRIIRIMVGIRNRDSCREYFKRLKILPLQSQYLLSLLLFVADNGDYFSLNSEIHRFKTKIKLNLHPPLSKLTVFQKGPYYSGIKAFNNLLPSYVKNLLKTKKHFKQALKEFLHFYSFYSLNEFYNYNRT
jgi:hypothetical protein